MLTKPSSLQIWIRDVFWLGPLGPDTQGAGILYAQKQAPYHEHEPTSVKGGIEDRWFMIGHLYWAYG